MRKPHETLESRAARVSTQLKDSVFDLVAVWADHVSKTRALVNCSRCNCPRVMNSSMLAKSKNSTFCERCRWWYVYEGQVTSTPMLAEKYGITPSTVRRLIALGRPLSHAGAAPAQVGRLSPGDAVEGKEVTKPYVEKRGSHWVHEFRCLRCGGMSTMNTSNARKTKKGCAACAASPDIEVFGHSMPLKVALSSAEVEYGTYLYRRKVGQTAEQALGLAPLGKDQYHR